ncbi:MAG TPA: flagellin [Brevundimonas sp.]|uniref:flagellin n=1 Tax=Brevundimonas sp. TaxID=1871086 RepID=UPI002616D5C8|nr:flagellin [Brevundimonas sp.]HRO33035.1 flagellin [Brevundimonas sp.]
MTRVSTFGNYEATLANLMFAENRANEALKRVSTQKNATSLVGFGRQSETLTALKSTQSRIQGFMDTAKATGERLAAQDLSLNRVADGTADTRQAIADALAAGRLDGLMLELQGQFQVVQDGLNGRHQGRYLFAGGNVETIPVQAMTLAELSAAPSVAATFSNDTLKQSSRVNEAMTLETGYLADEVGSEVFQIFRELQDWHQTTPLTGAPSDATRDFLTDILKRLDTARENVTDMTARNGSMQNRVEAVIASQTEQKTALDEMLADKTDADMARAITDLQLSQIAIQVSAQVVNQLQQASLLNFLR